MKTTPKPFEAILSEDVSSHDLGTLASKSPSFRFLASPAEELYCVTDGDDV